jgi:hypothetical protein
MGGEYLALSCLVCKHVSPYNSAEFHASGMTRTPDPFRNGELNLFHAYLECENKDCEFLVGVFAPRPASMTLAQVRDEFGEWTVGGNVKCVCGNAALSPKLASLRQYELDS